VVSTRLQLLFFCFVLRHVADVTVSIIIANSVREVGCVFLRKLQYDTCTFLILCLNPSSFNWNLNPKNNTADWFSYVRIVVPIGLYFNRVASAQYH
jgi:hypothetical protein